MKLILAFDSYKNALSSPEIHRILAEVFRRVRPDWEIVSLPLGDGGEGTAAAVTAALGGSMEELRVSDPLGRPVTAQWGRLPGRRAVLEMASASGIERLTRAELDPLRATTFGTGEMVRHLIEHEKIADFTVGIGGSATVDGGIGILQALGARFYDRAGRLVPDGAGGGALGEVARMELEAMRGLLKGCRFRVACDVVNVLTGPAGAAAVFGPQKGATPEQVGLLDRNLACWHKTACAAGVAPEREQPGDGAAGGLGFALRNFLRAEIVSSAEMVLELLEFDRALAAADWVLTGEGCSDFQTAQGKLCSRVAAHAHAAGVPVILLSGALGKRHEELQGLFDAALALSAGPGALEQAIAATPDNLRRMAEALAAMLKTTRKGSDDL